MEWRDGGRWRVDASLAELASRMVGALPMSGTGHERRPGAQAVDAPPASGAPEGTPRQDWVPMVAGSPAAFARLYEELAPRVFKFFVRAFRDPTLAEDLMQQTFLRAHKARHTYRGDASPRSWMFSIAAHVRVDELRARRRAPAISDHELDDDDVIAAPAPPLDPGERAELRANMAAAIDRLPESQRIALHLHRFEGLSFAEIAVALATTEGAARVRVCRALATLRKWLEPVLGEDQP